MSEWTITESQLYEINTTMQRVDHALLRNMLTRSAQESALFPLMPYVVMSQTDAYYAYPDLLRQASEFISPEQIGHRCRETFTGLTRMKAFSTLDFYLLGRANLIRLGIIRAEDNLEDLWFMCQWWNRFVRAFTREYAHSVTLDAHDIAPHHQERVLQVFEADAFACDANPKLRQAAAKFLATATQYNFMANCECRLGQQGAGPYAMGGDLLMHIRDFTNMATGSFSWLDGVAEQVPYNNLSMVIITKGVAVDITDFGSVYTVPEDYQSRIVGVGLYTSDFLSDGYRGVGMDSASDLTGTFEDLVEVLSAATRNIYKRIAGMTADQLIDAGRITYLQVAAPVTQMAGMFRQADWERLDLRNERLRGIYNDEFAMDAYLENYVLMSGHQGAENEYYLHPEYYNLWRRGGRAAGEPLPRTGRAAILVSSDVLSEHDYSRRVNPDGVHDRYLRPSTLESAAGNYRTSRGVLNEQEMNRLARHFTPHMAQRPWVYFDDQWVKYNWNTPEADEMYRFTQQTSRLLSGKGASLRRSDIASLRAASGDTRWESVD